MIKMENRKIKVYWMHCKSCEIILEKNIEKIKWVKVNKVSSKDWILDVDFKDSKSLDEIKNQIKESGYSLEKIKDDKNTFSDYLLIIIIALVVLILYLMIRNIEIFSFLWNYSNVTTSVAIITWVVASLSTCLAVTWGIVVWFSRYVDSSKWISSHIKVQSAFHAWRILGFFILWWLLGMFWWFIGFSMWLNNILLIIAWVIMLYMWLNILKIVPSITNLWVSMPKAISNKILNIKNPAFSPLIWALTFFLPCWFTQSMQIVAMSSWSFLEGGMIMWAFALWTLPILFLVWLWSSYIKDKKFNAFNKVIWVLIVFFATSILFSAWNLMSFSDNKSDSTSEIVNNDSSTIEEISVKHNGYSLEPETVKLKYWTNYKLTITPDNNWIWCMSTLVIPKINNEVHPIKKWIPISYTLNNLEKWTYRVVCWSMWMSQWEIVVE